MTDYLQIIIAVGVIASGVMYIASAIYKAKISQTKDSNESGKGLIDYLKAQIEAYKEVAKTQDEKIAGMGKEISAMRAIVAEKDKTIEKYLAILQNRNPELEKFMETISKTIVKNQETLEKILELNVAEAKRELKVETKITHDGKVAEARA